MLIGLVFMTISFAGLVLFKKLALFLAVLAVSSIGAGLILPCVYSLIIGSVSKNRRGFVTSLYGSVRFIGVSIGSPIFVRLIDWLRFGMFLSISALTYIILFL